MSVTTLTASSQTYLKAIWSLQEWSDDPVSTSMLASKVGVRLSTVSEAVRKLTEQGMLQHTRYGSVALTDEGARHAVAMVRRHRLIETFLAETLGYRWDQVHEEADALEHVVSDFMVERIDELLGHPVKDPHGDPIPSPTGDIEHPDGAMQLSTVGPGEAVRVERVSDSDPGLLQFLAECGIGVGTVLEPRPGAPYSDSIEVTVADRVIALGRSATDAVWVSVEPRD
ncbi:metal-dependent transcriptional regulator [Cutibacterium equinum]|uniref:Manganese transport regulator n=1 Tax=Cutibacterium equinum TaxID=3016342 RepID=A0ABY7QYE6_9ACTN|nr:metal-dependent transcriptional regulator [Cutibacterium equinum]WCC79579.1 metal-dependent transcriptional regulator [Cutibacterium equinum]